MKKWDEIINKALLGSEKAPLTADDIPSDIADEFVITTSPDKEENFLKISALAYQYRQSGARALNVSTIGQPAAAPEDKTYCAARANDILKTLLEENIAVLLEVWLQMCAGKNVLAYPEIIPALLDVARQDKDLRPLIKAVTGKRGEWLCNLNPQWNFFVPQADNKTTWDNGTADERKELLLHLRNVNPEEGRQLLEASWATEGANEKVAFLEILKTNLSPADLPWLEGLKEKGQRVNAAILALLKSIHSSTVVREYQAVLSKCFSIKTGKALLGMISKTELVIDQSFEFPESIFKTGIEKLSSDKNISDHQYILSQVIMSVPPSFWTEHLQRSAAELVALFQKEKQTAFYLPALAISATRVNDTEWIQTILDKGDKDIISSVLTRLIAGLAKKDRDQYALKYFEEEPSGIIQLMLHGNHEWSFDLARKILKYTAREVYQYNKQFYRLAVAHIPTGMLDQLGSFTPDEAQRQAYWNNQRDELARLLTLKQQTLQSFNA